MKELKEYEDPEIQIGDHVKVIKRSKIYNKNVNAIGWEGLVKAVSPLWVYIAMYWDGKLPMKGGGRLDLNSVEIIKPNVKHQIFPYYPPRLEFV